VIPILAVLPFLSAAGPAAEGVARQGWLGGLPEWAQGLAVLGAVALVLGGSRFLVNPAFRFIARARLRELLAAGSLLLVIAIARLMTEVGLSPALGTFLAGVVLAGSEYRHELESQMEVFKGLMLGLFFIAVGASLDLALVAGRPGLIAALVAGLVAVKFGVLAILARTFRLTLDQGLLFALALAQGGEFAFVLFSYALQHRVLPPDAVAALVVAVGLSMALTPLLLLFYERLIRPVVGTRERTSRPPDEMHGEAPVLIAGFGRFGHIVARLLRANGVEVTVLDVDSDQVDFLRRLGMEVFFGDACRVDLLEAAGAGRARLLVVAVDDPDTALRIVGTVRKHFPHLRLLARARNRAHAYELLEAGVDRVYRETLDTSLRVGMDALRELGFRSYRAWRSVRAFRRHEEASLREMAAVRHDRRLYTTRARRQIEEMERIMRAELDIDVPPEENAWDTSGLRSEAAAGGADGPTRPGDTKKRPG
jgi:voltage-gated potassium channel Kch